MSETEGASLRPQGDSGAAERIRAYRWSNTTLGALEHWPLCLQTAVDICLAAPEPSSVIWGPTYIQIPNDAYADDVVGTKYDTLLGRSFLDTFPAAHELLRPVLDRVRADGAPARFEYGPMSRLGWGDAGRETRFTFHFSAVREESGAVGGIFHRVTETPEPRPDPELRYRTLLYSFGDAVLVGEVITDAAGRAIDFRCREVNAAYEAMTGLSPAEVIGKAARDVLPGIDPSWIAGFGRAGLQGKTIRIEEYNAALRKWLSIRFSPVGERGSGLVAAIFTDVTLRKRADAALLEAAAHTAFRVALADALRPLTDAAEIQAVAARVIGEHLGASRVHYAEFEDDGEHANVLRDYARDGSNAPGRYYLHAFEIFMRECRAGRTLVVNDVATDSRLDETEKGLFGTLAIVGIVAVPLLKAGKLIAVFAVHRDAPYEWTAEEISLVEETAERALGALDRARSERALSLSEERFRLLVEGARDYAMFLLDAAGQVTFWSAGAERIFGWTADEAKGRGAEFLFVPEDRERGVPVQEIDQARDTGQAADRRWHLRKDGSRFWADGMLMRLTDTDGGLRGFAKVARDATDQKQAEEAKQAALEAVERANQDLERRVAERTEELVRLNRMHQELLRKLVTAQEQERARISRDLHDDTGQQVTALILGLSYLKNSEVLASDPEAQELLTRLEGHASDVAKKSHQLSFTLRPTALDDIGLMGALRNYVDEWSTWSGVTVDLQGVGLENEEGTQSDRLSTEIETTIYRVAQEALTNILRHAVIGVSGTSREARRVSIVVQRGARNVVTVIEDDGPGFDVEGVLNAPPGNRRLGIFGMQERAHLAGGTLTIESERGKGSTVFLRLPLPSP